MKLEFSRQRSEKYSSIKVYGNSSSGGRDVLCGRTDGHTDMMKQVVAFRNFYSYYRPPYRDWLFLSFFSFLSLSGLRFFDTTTIIFVLFLHHGQDSSLKRQTDPSKSVCLWFLFFLKNSFRSTLDVTSQYLPPCVWIACHSFYSLRISVSSFLWNHF